MLRSSSGHPAPNTNPQPACSLTMKTRIIITVSIAALLLAALPSARSAVVTTATTATPDAATIIAFAEGPTTSAMGVRWDTSIAGATGHRDISQSFLVASATTLASFTLKQANDQPTPAALVNLPFTVKIYKIPSASALPDAAGSELVSTQTGTWTVPGGTVKDSYITFTLDQSVSLGANTYYAFALGFDQSASGANFIASTSGNGTLYANGLAAGLAYDWNTSAAGSWASFSTDYIFYVNTAAAAVPESATTAALLGALAIAATALARRKRR
ncbi:MAG: PEP-CTERM sorting domain-containing protein [Opitutaceae bacterium]|nr:PEP-CTERM sorting domain-containing protein [Opitutaceae bacterium]